MNKKLWLLWFIVCLGLGSFFAWKLIFSEDKSVYLIGETTYGHYQIEMSCETCHTDPFGGKEVLQNACTQCHAEELKEAHDSHPKNKFTDPREAYRLEQIDARYCISCHVEHQNDATHPMGVTLPDDYCYHCHIETIEERDSHKNLAFDSCADAGCHNYHDNRALYESFLVQNANKPWLLESIALVDKNGTDHQLPVRNYAHYKAPTAIQALAVSTPPDTPADWHDSAHQKAGISCESCHAPVTQPLANQLDEQQWIDKPNIEQCQACHAGEAKSFKAGKHGMRLIISDAPKQTNSKTKNAPQAISPAESRLKFSSSDLTAPHGCNSCHGAHQYDTTFASVDGCLSCHQDEHSLNYENSPHGLSRKTLIEQKLEASSSVSCASCHMPLIASGKHQAEVGTTNANQSIKQENSNGDKTSIDLFSVQHNQNWNLRPNEKMIRSVCMDCHSLAFSIDALADQALIKSNFTGKPSKHIESIDWALEREQQSTKK